LRMARPLHSHCSPAGHGRIPAPEKVAMFADFPCSAAGAFDLLPLQLTTHRTRNALHARIANPGDASIVAQALLEYLRNRLDMPSLRYASAPAPVADGWETYIYAFRLQADGLPPMWDRPLMLRIHVNCEAILRVEREFIVPQ